jgi:hypothetical protein
MLLQGRGERYNAMLRRLLRLRSIWRWAGMRFKVKLVVSAYQCLAVVPRVFDVTTPRGLEEFNGWLRLIEFPADLGVDAIIPASCFGL